MGRDCGLRRAGIRSDAAARAGAPPDGAGERTVASLRYTDAIVGALEELAATLPSTEFTAELLDALRDAYQPGRGVAEAFGRFIDRVLGPHGLVVYDASDPAAKPFAAPIFRPRTRAPGQTNAWRRRPGADLVALRLSHAGARRTSLRRRCSTCEGGRKAIRAAG